MLGGLCGVDGCIGAVAIGALVGSYFGAWALGYGVGASVLWVNRLKGVA